MVGSAQAVVIGLTVLSRGFTNANAARIHFYAEERKEEGQASKRKASA
jgi:hypothetical protein